MAFSGQMKINRQKTYNPIKYNRGPETSLQRRTVALPPLKLNNGSIPNTFT
jgi:hypothetical protein